MDVPTDFAKWLNTKLQKFNTDESVFGSYIIGILQGDEAYEEKHEALEGILSEFSSENIDAVVKDILKKWSECNEEKESYPKKRLNVTVEDQLVKLLETTKVQPIATQRQYTLEEKRIREQILAQYSQTAVSEDLESAQSDEENVKQNSGINKSTDIERNTNVSDVVALQKKKREQARLESASKKQKDKEDREKQKQIREEKKEKRKTVKGERRR